jgi:tellurite resistance protein TehA-like permease
MIYGMSAFFILLLFFVRLMLTSVPFSMAWWAYTFPFATFGALTVRYHQALSAGMTDNIGFVPTFVLVVIVAALVNLTWLSVFTFTLVYVLRRRLFVPWGSKQVVPLQRGNTVSEGPGRL